MYQYLDRFTEGWTSDDLIEILGSLPEEYKLDVSAWAPVIACVGVQGFTRLCAVFPNQPVKFPSLFELLAVFAAKEIVLKMRTMSREDATKEVLGTLKLQEVDRLVDRLCTSENSASTQSNTSKSD